ncbi:MAG: hypothetical protein QXX29_00800, partial [Nitrososphaerota archaeon]
LKPPLHAIHATTSSGEEVYKGNEPNHCFGSALKIPIIALSLVRVIIPVMSLFIAAFIPFYPAQQ